MQIINNDIGRKIFFVADWHIGHRNIIKYCNRPFESVNQMNSYIQKRHNQTVGKDDVVYVLGDVTFLNMESSKEFIKSLNGFKFLIKGNHDRKSNEYYRKLGFIEVYDNPIIFGKNTILSHEPIMDELYNKSPLFNIYGHIHDKALNIPGDHKFCCSVEKTDYKPVSLNEIIQFASSEIKPVIS